MNDTDILKIDRLSYVSEKTESLINISFSIKKGEHIVIFGPENSGLEILCPLIAGLKNDFEGDIFYKGKSIKSFDYIENHNYRKRLGYLQRGHGLINNMSVEANISLPLKYHTRLSTFEIHNIVDKYIMKMNLHKCRENRPVNLSRSETLKTAFIRSIILEPDLLLIEHPLEGQCLLNVQTFIDSFKKDSQLYDKSVIFVTYSPMQFIDFSHKFIMLYNGNIVFNGSKSDLITTKNDYVSQFLSSSSNGPMKIL